MVQENVPHRSRANASKSPAQTVLYKDGREIVANATDVEAFMAEGWSRDLLDPTAGIADLGVLSKAMVSAFESLYKEAKAGNGLATHEAGAVAVAQRAFVELAETASNILNAIQLMHPVQQGDAVQLTRTITNAGGEPVPETMDVDPNQVKLYTAQGWAKG